MSDKPYKLPPPMLLANMLAQRAWDDDVDDDTRLLCEMAADTIRAMASRLMKTAHSLEHAEATNEQLGTYISVLCGQKGGAA